MHACMHTNLSVRLREAGFEAHDLVPDAEAHAEGLRLLALLDGLAVVQQRGIGRLDERNVIKLG